MRVAIDVPESLVENIRQAVDQGDYRDSREFVRVAIENQLQREGIDKSNVKTLSEAIEEVGNSKSEISDNETELPNKKLDEHNKSEESGAKVPSLPDQSNAHIGLRQYDSVKTISPPNTERLDDGPLWGQYNRLFPIKLTVRVLANKLVGQNKSTDWLDFSPFQNQVGKVARTVGNQIETYDEQFGRKRGEKLSTGLPTGDEVEKSTDRFQTHFVGRIEHDDMLSGASPNLKFIDITQNDRRKIGLTESGKDFAALQNPLLDTGFDAEYSLTEEECQFYLSHVREARPEEHEAMLKISQAIEEGDNRPSVLTERVAFLNTSWSNSKANTIRSGLTSRMYELGLVNRGRVGQRGIAYELTSLGETFLNKRVAFEEDTQ